MRVLALARFRLTGARSGRVLLAPLVALVAVQVVGLAGGRQAAAVLMVTSACLALPLLAWLARNVLDAEPDDQVLLSGLAVGGAVRASLAGLLSAYALCAPLALLCALAALLRVDGDGAPVPVVLLGALLALGVALAAVAVGASAARAVAGSGAWPVVVLVGAPVLVAVVGLADSAVVRTLVPRLVDLVRVCNVPPPVSPNVPFVAEAPPLVAQVAAWGFVLVGARLLIARRRS